MKEAEKYTDEQLKETLNIAQKIKVVQNDEVLTKKQKKQKIRQLVKKNKKLFLKMVFIFLKRKLWTERSWAIRLALIAIIPGVIKGGSVGLATMGIGVGIPMFLITSFGGAFIGMVIDEIKRELKRKKSG
ncbi:MAG: hypothetical protein OXH36_03285 [Bdellovibrionales bacterium]|nr:hypothetical protein [Bdellovibrionales bacterium]